jgi:hypothetical protein
LRDYLNEINSQLLSFIVIALLLLYPIQFLLFNKINKYYYNILKIRIKLTIWIGIFIELNNKNDLRYEMKRLIILFFIVITSTAFNVKTAAQNDGDNYGYFYASLSPYGSWIELNSGVTVWRPNHLNHGWSPYRDGRWIWTDDGWYWDSDEPYGNIVYHYGRWYDDDYYGWIWVPDNVWAPAWVQWRYDNDYIGWAPLPPYASFSIGFGISFTTNYVTPVSYWHFVGYNRICDPYVTRYYIRDRDRDRIFSNTRYRTNYGYSNGRVINRGVDVDYVRQRGGGRIVEQHIQRVDDPRNAGSRGSNNVIRAYIPTREQIASTDARNVQIKKATRPASLDVSKVEIGRTNRVAQNNNPGIINRNNKVNNRTPDRVVAPNREVPRNNSQTMRENNRTNPPENRPQTRNNISQQPNRNNPQSSTINRPQQRVQSQVPNRPQQRVQSQIPNRPQIKQQPRIQQNVAPRRPSPPPQSRNQNRRSGH